MTDPQTTGQDNQQHDDELAQRTGGFAGQAGYQSEFSEGSYQDQETAESGDTEDRAGSHEDGYQPGAPGDSLRATPPRDDVGNQTVANNYNEGREVDETTGATTVED